MDIRREREGYHSGQVLVEGQVVRVDVAEEVDMDMLVYLLFDVELRGGGNLTGSN